MRFLIMAAFVLLNGAFLVSQDSHAQSESAC